MGTDRLKQIRNFADHAGYKGLNMVKFPYFLDLRAELTLLERETGFEPATLSLEG